MLLVRCFVVFVVSEIDSGEHLHSIHSGNNWRVRLSVQDAALSRPKDGFDSRTRYHLYSMTYKKCSKIYFSKSFLISKNTGSTRTLQLGSILTPAF